MRITFDPAKDESNQAKHGVALSLAEQVDWQEVWAKPDDRCDYRELREIGFAVIEDCLYVVVFVQRGADEMRIISLRKSNRREVKHYVDET